MLSHFFPEITGYMQTPAAADSKAATIIAVLISHMSDWFLKNVFVKRNTLKIRYIKIQTQ